jgi:hypothetical protein
MSLNEWIPSTEARARGYDSVSIARMERVEKVRAEGLRLIAQIEKALPSMPRPRITLSVARGLDDEWDLREERERELAAQDPEQSWQDVSDEDIETHGGYFTFADAEGWRFYLPAFMCHWLRTFPLGNWGIESACESMAHTGLLDHEQMQCLVRFADFLRKHEDDPWDTC